MSHKIDPHQRVKIMLIEVAFPADAPFAEIADTMAGLLSEQGDADSESVILDWRYTGHQKIVNAPAEPEEGEIFGRYPADWGA